MPASAADRATRSAVAPRPHDHRVPRDVTHGEPLERDDDLDGIRLAGRDLDTRESDEPWGVGRVHLHDVGAGAVAGVAHRRPHRDGVVARRRRGAVQREGRVAQAEAERVRRGVLPSCASFHQPCQRS